MRKLETQWYRARRVCMYHSDVHFGVLHDIQLVQLLYYEHQIRDRRT